jgi:pentatricopeptide repeat protein
MITSPLLIISCYFLFEAVEADSSVLAGMVEWCTFSDRFDLGDDIFDAAERARLPMTPQLGTNLIEMYVKSSNLDKAIQVWSKMKQRNSTTATAAARLVWLIATHYGVDKASAFYQGSSLL